MPAKSPPCKCGPEHWRMLHPRTGAQCEGGAYEEARPEGGTVLVRPCDCTRYRKAKGANVVSKRRIVAFAKEAERWVADALSGIRLPAIGDSSRPDVIRYGKDGEELLAVEVKHRPLSKFIEASVAQAEKAARTRRGRPLAVAVHVDKPGRGVEREGFAILRLRTLAALLERLEGE